MDKWQALQVFWESFGIPAYDENTVPDEAVMPYITYEASAGAYDTTIPLSANLWYLSESWADISRKAQEVLDYIGESYTAYTINGGYLYIPKNNITMQRMRDDSDPLVRRILIQYSCEFITRT